MWIEGTYYLPWVKWKERVEKYHKIGVVPIPRAYPKELWSLYNQKYINKDEFERVKEMIYSPDKENFVIAQEMLLQLRRRRLRGLR